MDEPSISSLSSQSAVPVVEAAEDETPNWPARYGVGALVAAIGTMMLGAGLALAPVTVVTSSQDFESDPISIFASTLVLDTIFVFAAIGFASVAQPLRLKQFGLRKVKIKKAIGWMAVGMLIYLPVFFLLWSLVPEAKEEIERFSVAGWIVIFVAIGIFPPLSEEFLFRGFIYQAFRNRMGMVLAAVGSSLLFGLGHIQGFSLEEGLVPIAWTTVFGMAMCLVFQKTRSLYPNMGVHAIHNGTLVILAATLT